MDFLGWPSPVDPFDTTKPTCSGGFGSAGSIDFGPPLTYYSWAVVIAGLDLAMEGAKLDAHGCWM
jgi:hypothetical protein